MAKAAAKKTTAKKAVAKPTKKAAKPTAKKAAKPAAKKSVAKSTARPKKSLKPVTAKTSVSKKNPSKKAVTVKTKPAKAPKTFPAKKIAYFKKKLETEKQRVLAEVNGIQQGNLKQSISDESGENSRYSYHLGDVASLSYGREFTMGLAERQQKYLEQIDDALQRIENGTYGICKVTGEIIPVERLEEVPVAKYSVKGKELLNRRKKMGLG